MKAVAFNGSPRKSGNTEFMLKTVYWNDGQGGSRGAVENDDREGVETRVMNKRYVGILACVAGMALSGMAGAETRTWTGAVSADWFDAGNWNPDDNIPQADDTVVILSGASVLLTNQTAELAVFSMTNATLTFSNWVATLRAVDVDIWHGATLTHAPVNTNAAPGITNRVHLIGTEINLASGSSIIAEGLGHRTRMGPGAGWGESGGGYAGRGGGPLGGNGYGIPSVPIDPGSGGGGNNGALDGAGGGLVTIDASGGALQLDGLINVSGLRAGDHGQGSGSGGGVWIVCDTVSGSGSILADGGSAGTGRGGGSGGRIAIVYETGLQADVDPKPTVTVSARGGAAPSGFPGEMGSVYFSDDTIFARTNSFSGMIQFEDAHKDVELLHDWTLVSADAAFLPGTHLRIDGNLLLTNNARLRMYGASTNGVDAYGAFLDITGTFGIAAGCWFFPYSDPTNGGSVRTVANAVRIDQGGGIDAVGLGYATMQGPGFAAAQGGGGYGGKGGATAGGIAYGSPYLPLSPGSGGGGNNAQFDGPGGGLVWIEASNGLVRVDGEIDASGVRAGTHGQGSGSGGGVYILCQTFEGSGSVRADGATGGNANRGGGGGGRIAVLYCTESQKSVTPVPGVLFSARNGLAGNRADHGGLGSLFFPDGALVALTNRFSGILHPAIPSANIAIPHSWTLDAARLGFLPGQTVSVDGDLSLTNGAELFLFAAPTNGATLYGGVLDVSGMFQVGGGCRVYPHSDPTNGGSMLMRVRHFALAGDARVDAIGRGYGTLQGPGAGTQQGGGGYGGQGGAEAGGGVYGSSYVPFDAGSGGGGNNAQLDGPGGGLVWIEAPGGSVRVDGEIDVSGVEAGYHRQGSGAGGGVLIVCRSFSGSGEIRADGADGGANVLRGGGGGGRVAVLRVAKARLHSLYQGDTTGIQWIVDPDLGVAVSVNGGGGVSPGDPGSYMAGYQMGTVYLFR